MNHTKFEMPSHSASSSEYNGTPEHYPNESHDQIPASACMDITQIRIVGNMGEVSFLQDFVHLASSIDYLLNRGSVGLLAYVNGVINYTVIVYLQTAAAEFKSIVQFTTLAVVQTMMVAAAKPMFAKFADIFGCSTSFIIAICLQTIGAIVLASVHGISTLGGGMVLFALAIRACRSVG